MINGNSALSVLSKDIASEIKCVICQVVHLELYADFLLSSLQQQLAEAQVAFQSRSQEHDLKRRELQGVEAQYREADVSRSHRGHLHTPMNVLNVAPFQAKLKKLKSGRDRTEREMSKFDMELEQAVPADMTIFEENIEVRHLSP